MSALQTRTNFAWLLVAAVVAMLAVLPGVAEARWRPASALAAPAPRRPPPRLRRRPPAPTSELPRPRAPAPAGPEPRLPGGLRGRPRPHRRGERGPAASRHALPPERRAEPPRPSPPAPERPALRGRRAALPRHGPPPLLLTRLAHGRQLRGPHPPHRLPALGALVERGREPGLGLGQPRNAGADRSRLDGQPRSPRPTSSRAASARSGSASREGAPVRVGSAGRHLHDRLRRPLVDGRRFPDGRAGHQTGDATLEVPQPSPPAQPEPGDGDVPTPGPEGPRDPSGGLTRALARGLLHGVLEQRGHSRRARARPGGASRRAPRGVSARRPRARPPSRAPALAGERPRVPPARPRGAARSARRAGCGRPGRRVPPGRPPRRAPRPGGARRAHARRRPPPGPARALRAPRRPRSATARPSPSARRCRAAGGVGGPR